MSVWTACSMTSRTINKSILPDDIVAVEGNLAGFGISAIDIVELRYPVADYVFECLFDARHTYVEVVTERVEEILDTVADYLRVVTASDGHVVVQNLPFVCLQLFERDTFRMPEVEEICNKITVIDHGKVIATGTKEEIIDRMGRDREIDVTFASVTDGLNAFEDAVSQIDSVHRCSRSVEDDIPTCKIFYSDDLSLMENVIRLATEHHLTITNIGSLEPSLEEVFLTLTGKELRDGK